MPVADSFAAFAHQLIDYAGLFPPARLALPAALADYARYRADADRWLLGRFIIPAARLDDLDDALMAPFTAASPLPFSVIVADPAADLPRIAACLARYGDRVTFDALETRLPPAGDVAPAVAAVWTALDAAGLPLQPFFELPFNAAWDDRLADAIHAVADHNADHGTRGAFKLRCGGVAAADFPTTAQVARAVALCAARGLPFKATAGLHHPLRRYDTGVETMMHGFVNLFGAAVLAAVHQLAPETIRPILDEEDADQFRFDAAGFHWRDLTAATADIAAARAELALAYGSCSFDEPRDDLRELGLLPAVAPAA